MKKNILLFLAILAIFYNSSSQDTMYIYKSGAILNWQAISDIDSIVFYRDIKVMDIDSNIYQTIKIGTQLWMNENLKVTKYNDGTPLSYPGNNAYNWNNTLFGAYAWYLNNESSYKSYGALYNGYAVITNKLCPVGWHVPSEYDWEILVKFLGGATISGLKLKEIGTSHWTAPNSNVTNDYGFNALPSGIKDSDGDYLDIKNKGYWWSTTQMGGYPVLFYRYMIYNSSEVLIDNAGYNSGLSVRCIKD